MHCNLINTVLLVVKKIIGFWTGASTSQTHYVVYLELGY